MKQVIGVLAVIMGLVVMLALLASGWLKIMKRSESSTQNEVELPTPNLKLPTTSTNQTQEFKTKLYQLINAYRKENHLIPLLVHPRLEASAKLKLDDMIAKNYWQHEDDQNRPPWQFFEQANYHYQKAGENLGFNQSSAFAVFQAWTKSAKHNQQLLDPSYEHMGLAIDCDILKTQRHDAGCIVVLHLGNL